MDSDLSDLLVVLVRTYLSIPLYGFKQEQQPLWKRVLGGVVSFQFHCMDSCSCKAHLGLERRSLSIPLYGFMAGFDPKETLRTIVLSIPLYGFSPAWSQWSFLKSCLSIPLYGFEPGEPSQAGGAGFFQFHCMDSAPSRFMFTVEISLISIVWILFH
jgi:hypothetical protein